MAGFSNDLQKHSGYNITECTINETIVTLKIAGIVVGAPVWEVRFGYDGQKIYADGSNNPQTNLGILLDN